MGPRDGRSTGVGGEKCPKRWQDTLGCQLPQGHVGPHINHTTGLEWWGQVPLTDHAAPQVHQFGPQWADESDSLLLSAAGRWLDKAPIKPRGVVFLVCWFTICTAGLVGALLAIGRHNVGGVVLAVVIWLGLWLGGSVKVDGPHIKIERERPER